jgi:hypothetical protein
MNHESRPAAHCPTARARIILAAGLAITSAGCPGTFDGTMNSSELLTDGNRDETLTSPLGKTAGEPNGSFDDPIVAVFDAARAARLQGAVSRRGDLDVFQVNGLGAGDRVVIDCATPASALDVSIAVFDDRQRLVMTNDDRGGSTDRFLDSFVDWIARHDAEPHYLVVTHAAFAASGRFTGNYTVDVTVTPGSNAPAPAPQTLLLNFNGGLVQSDPLGTFDLDPFDAGRIAAAYAGRTTELKNVIVDTMRQNYERFNVDIITTDDPPPPSGTEFSTIHFGGFDPFAFGIAEQVDLYNADFCDDAVIFAESFEPRVFSSTPNVDELGIAIGNVAAHEAGHLLGLNHVTDDRALMDDQSPADAFIVDQEFMQAPLSPDIMRIGTQDAVLLLNETVGPR